MSQIPPVAADLHFYFDPMCPFAWMTSKWVRMVAAQRDYDVDWRFISLRFVNEGVDYDSHFPPEYAAMHLAGLKLLRMAARTRAEHGREGVARLYAAYGAYLWDAERQWSDPTGAELVGPALTTAGLPQELADALEDDSWDAEILAETAEALALTGKDVGTPILHFFTRTANEPPVGVAFFGPVISRLPSEAEAAELWDHVIGLARFPGFAELKRSLRELPQLRALGVKEEEVGKQEDWHGGSRRLKK
jgi:2-hydroxychromene-2-carboxylate isomerase